jgi:predicted NAD/FAD-dependent oxidoreductase
MFDEILTDGLCKIEAPIYIHNSLRVSAGDPAKNKIARYCYEAGNAELPHRLAEGLDLRLGTKIEHMLHRQELYEVGGELFEAVILAIPTPEAQQLIESVGESRPFQNSSYRPCLSVMLGYPVPAPNVVYHALLDPDSGHPLTWLSIETLKCPHRSPEGKTAMVVQLSPQFTKMYFESSDETIVEATADLIERLYGKAWDVAPEVAIVKRWRYSQPEMTALFDSVNRPHSKLLIAGDGVMGGRVEYAYDAGLKAARLAMGEA